MATISPSPDLPASGVETAVWETLTENDTAASQLFGGLLPLAGSVQVTGTFGGATIVLQASNDGSNWVTVKDTSGDAISFTATGLAEFSTAALYLRPSASGGTSQDLDVTICARR